MFKKLINAIKALTVKAIERILWNDLYLAYNGDRFYYVLWDFDNDVLRYLTKHNPENLTEEQIEILVEVRERLYGLMILHDVDFNHVQ